REHLAQVDAASAAQAAELAEEVDLDYLRANLPRLLKRTRDGVERVSRIVQSLRGLARTGSETPRRHDTHLPDLVETSLEILRGRMKKAGIEVEIDHGPAPRLPCVASQISQVLLNLFMNATQAIETAQRKPGRIAIKTRRLGDEMLIEVEDN